MSTPQTTCLFTRFPVSILLLATLLFACTDTTERGADPAAIAESHIWQPDPEVIASREENRPDYIWREEDVPDYDLPDPLMSESGQVINQPEEWPERRAEILEQFRSHMYGHRPGPPDESGFDVIEENPDAMNGAATLRIVEITSRHDGREHSFDAIFFLPNDRTDPAPLFLLMNNRDRDNTDPTREEQSGFWPAEEVIERGYAIGAIQNNDLAPDDDDEFHEGVIRLFEGDDSALHNEREPDAWGALAAWGWGASRVMDYLETDPELDGDHVALLGHSRGGKASLWAGAEDERFSLVISNESGSGGAALSKREYGETIRAVNRFTHWFTGNFMEFNDHEAELPFDQHMLISLIAPRAVYIGSADEDLWADPRGEFLSLAHASPVYSLWGYEAIQPGEMPGLDDPLFRDPRGYHVRSGGHNLTPQDWHYYMDAADRLWE